MNAVKILIGFVPFVAFSLLVHVFGVVGAAAAGSAAAIAVVAATAKGGLKILPSVQAVILLVITVIAAISGESVRADLVDWGPVAAALLMGAFMIGTAWVMPFSAQQARASVPPQVWHSKPFLDINRRISIAWGLAVLVLGLCHLAGAGIEPSGAHLILRLAVNWVLPGVAFWRAAVYTKHTVATAAQRLHAAQDSAVRNGS